MTTCEGNKGNEPTSVARVESMLWALGSEHPECREVIAETVGFLRKKFHRELQRAGMATVYAATFTGENMRRIRGAKNMQVDHLAEKLGVTRQAIYKYERKGIPQKRIVAIADILGVGVHDLTAALGQKDVHC